MHFRFRIESEEDLLESMRWYENRRAGLAEELLKELETDLRKILQNPRMCRQGKRQTRECVVKRFPFLIVYRILEDRCDVLAHFHTSRNPDDKLKHFDSI